MGMPRKKTKSPPILSHEFAIQNHADILACLAILIVAGMMFEKTAHICRMFVFLQYGIKNQTDASDDEAPNTGYARGLADLCQIFFAGLMVSVFHAVLQEYGIDKISKKLHLSKTKTSKFSESGQLSVWSVISTIWGICEIYQGNYLRVAHLWEGYPHIVLDWNTKIYLICQIAYWLHMYPELYFQKVKKEEMSSRFQYYTLHFVFIATAYVMHFWKICILFLTLHYATEAVLHASRLLHYADKHYAKYGFLLWKYMFPAVRFVTLVFSIVMFWFGLASIENQGVNFGTGCFNSLFIRILSAGGLFLLQGWLMWLFFNLQLRKSKEEAEIKRKADQAAQAAIKTQMTKKPQQSTDDMVNASSARQSNKLKKRFKTSSTPADNGFGDR